MSFDKKYAGYKDRFERAFYALMGGLQEVPEPLYSSMQYAVTSGGKRLRPVLLCVGCEMFADKITAAAEKAACAVECIHTYSLLHDDLPCMDNADLRRGKPSSHKVFGECVAVLTGDALLNYAYELLFEAASECEPEQRDRFIRAGKLISRLAGKNGLVGGQILDTVDGNRKHLSIKLNYVYQHKTADLITASLCAGAIIGGASEADLKLLTEVGDNLGYGFQITDDLIDRKNGEDSDKKTFVEVYGVRESKKAVCDRTALALTALSKINADTSFLHALIKKFAIRKK